MSSRRKLPGQVPAEGPDPAKRQSQLQRVAARQQRGEDRRGHQQHRGHQKPAQPGPRVVAEQPRGGFHPDQRVILAVLMGIDRVVEQRPGDARRRRAAPAASARLPACAAQASSAPQLKARPRKTCGHQVKRLAKG